MGGTGCEAGDGPDGTQPALSAKRMGYGDSAEPLLRELIETTPAEISQVQTDLPPGFSPVAADKVLGGLLVAARALEAMKAS